MTTQVEGQAATATATAEQPEEPERSLEASQQSASPPPPEILTQAEILTQTNTLPVPPPPTNTLPVSTPRVWTSPHNVDFVLTKEFIRKLLRIKQLVCNCGSTTDKMIIDEFLSLIEELTSRQEYGKSKVSEAIDRDWSPVLKGITQSSEIKGMLAESELKLDMLVAETKIRLTEFYDSSGTKSPIKITTPNVENFIYSKHACDVLDMSVICQDVMAIVEDLLMHNATVLVDMLPSPAMHYSCKLRAGSNWRGGEVAKHWIKGGALDVLASRFYIDLIPLLEVIHLSPMGSGELLYFPAAFYLALCAKSKHVEIGNTPPWALLDEVSKLDMLNERMSGNFYGLGVSLYEIMDTEGTLINTYLRKCKSKKFSMKTWLTSSKHAETNHAMIYEWFHRPLAFRKMVCVFICAV